MEKNNLEFLELFGEIDDDLIRDAGKDWNKKAEKQIHRGIAVKAACIFLIAVISVCSLFGPQVKGAIEEAGAWFRKIWSLQKDLSSYTETVDTSLTKDGITLTLKEVILTDRAIYAAVIMETEEKEVIFSSAHSLKINGEECILKSTAVSQGNDPLTENQYILECVLEENTVPDMISDVELCLNVYPTDEDWEHDHAVPFTFAFSASREELEKGTVRKSLDQVIEIQPGSYVRLTDFYLNDICSEVHARKEKLSEKYGELYLEGEDDLGNWVLYYSFPDEEGFSTWTGAGNLPSIESEWVELQLWTYVNMDEIEEGMQTETFYDENGNELGFETNGQEQKKVLLGDKFRIYLK